MVLVLLQFVHTSLFDESAADVLTDNDLRDLQQTLIENPEAGAVLRGAGGVRKVRVGREAKGKGKRGGARVIYYYQPSRTTVYLLLAYGKDEADDLSEAGKKVMQKLVRELEGEA